MARPSTPPNRRAAPTKTGTARAGKRAGKRDEKPIRPKMVSARKAEKLRRKMYLRGPLDGWSFPLALISSMLFSSSRLLAALRGQEALDDALMAWGGALLFCWVCWEVIASAMRSVNWDDEEGITDSQESPDEPDRVDSPR